MSHSRKPSFHQILQKERKKQGWSQQYIAEKLGIDTNTVSRWERGLNVPYPIYRSKLSELFGITPEEFGLASEGSEITPVVFLSYAQADVLIANRIREDLKHRGIAVWSNEDGKPNTSEVLQPALQNVQALILLASLDASSANSVSDELEIAETCKCPVYALWIAGERRTPELLEC